jgi:hypothetical protein
MEPAKRRVKARESATVSVAHISARMIVERSRSLENLKLEAAELNLRAVHLRTFTDAAIIQMARLVPMGVVRLKDGDAYELVHGLRTYSLLLSRKSTLDALVEVWLYPSISAQQSHLMAFADICLTPTFFGLSDRGELQLGEALLEARETACGVEFFPTIKSEQDAAAVFGRHRAWFNQGNAKRRLVKHEKLAEESRKLVLTDSPEPHEDR